MDEKLEEMSDEELKIEIRRLKDLIEKTNRKTADIKEKQEKQILKILELCSSVVSDSRNGP